MELGVVLIAGVVIVITLILIYNSLVGKKNQVANVFGSIDAMLKKRYDLIPNLVSTCKQYMSHERETLTKITELRTQAISGGMDPDQRVALDNQLSKMLSGVMVAVENYPALKANENMIHLQRTLTEVEEQLSAARRAYNAAVTDYNNACEMIPTNIFASMMGYRLKELFEIPEAERRNVNIGELFGN